MQKRFLEFTLESIKIRFSLLNDLRRISVEINEQPSTGGFKNECKKYLLEECTLNIVVDNAPNIIQSRNVFLSSKIETETNNQSKSTKTIQKKLEFDKDLKIYIFPLSHNTTHVCNDIERFIQRKYNAKIESDRIPEEIFSIIFKSPQVKRQEIDDNSQALATMKRLLPSSLVNKLFPYQIEGVTFCIVRGFCCMIADGMGLGKTLQTLCAFKVCKEMYKELIEQAKRNIATTVPTESEKYKNLVVVPTKTQNSTSMSSATNTTLTIEQQKRREMLAAMNAKTTEATKSLAAASSSSSSINRNLQLLLNRKKNFKLLIICPSSLRTQWCEEFKRWLPDDYTDKNILCVFKNTDLQNYDESLHDIVVISYALAAKNDAAFKQIGFDFCVADESHQLKNAKSARTEKLTPIMQSIRYRLLLSGTPAFAKPNELYPQISIINPHLFSSFTPFGMRYCDGKQSNITIKGKYGAFKPMDFSGCSNSAELNLVLKEHCMIRRVKEDVLKELPDKLRTKIYISANINKSLQKQMQEAEKLLADLEKNEDSLMLNDVGDDVGVKEPTNLYPDREESVLETYVKLAKSKIDPVTEYLEDFYEEEANQEEKTLIFYHHEEMGDALEKFFKEKFSSLARIRIDGKTMPARRGQLVNDYQTKPEIKIALLSITAAGVGITLTAASRVIFSELHWTPGMILQAEDRSHRIGQKRIVNIIYLILKNSFEEIMWRMIDKKIRNVGKILDNDHLTKGMKINSHVNNISSEASSAAIVSPTADSSITEFKRLDEEDNFLQETISSFASPVSHHSQQESVIQDNSDKEVSLSKGKPFVSDSAISKKVISLASLSKRFDNDNFEERDVNDFLERKDSTKTTNTQLLFNKNSEKTTLNEEGVVRFEKSDTNTVKKTLIFNSKHISEKSSLSSIKMTTEEITSNQDVTTLKKESYSNSQFWKKYNAQTVKNSVQANNINTTVIGKNVNIDSKKRTERDIDTIDIHEKNESDISNHTIGQVSKKAKIYPDDVISSTSLPNLTSSSRTTISSISNNSNAKSKSIGIQTFFKKN